MIADKTYLALNDDETSVILLDTIESIYINSDDGDITITRVGKINDSDYFRYSDSKVRDEDYARIKEALGVSNMQMKSLY